MAILTISREYGSGGREIGLSGELRAVSQTSNRLKEAAKLGFRRCIVPRSTIKAKRELPKDLEVIGCRTLRDALEAALISR